MKDDILSNYNYTDSAFLRLIGDAEFFAITKAEIELVSNIRDAFEIYGQSTKVSSKELNWLIKLSHNEAAKGLKYLE